MFINSNLTDKLIIFLGCLIIYLCQADLDINVVPVLIGITFSGFLNYFDTDRPRALLTVGYFALACFMPELAFFLPLIIYDMQLFKYLYVNFFALIPLLCFFKRVSLQLFLVVTILLFLCILLRYRWEKYIKMYFKYHELSDTAREMSMKLEKQNRELIESQDNERTLAALNERNRIAREIHDNVGHLLSSAILQAGALLTINQDEKVRDGLEVLNNTLSQAMNSIRASIHNLYDESIDLNAEIEKIIDQFTFCEVSYDYHINTPPEKKLKYTFIFIVKEALANIMKHSNATHVSITFREHPAFYQLIISDNGKVKGYSIDNGLGLRNIIERVHSFSGNINIITEKGFEIFISIPKEGPQT